MNIESTDRPARKSTKTLADPNPYLIPHLTPQSASTSNLAFKYSESPNSGSTPIPELTEPSIDSLVSPEDHINLDVQALTQMLSRELFSQSGVKSRSAEALVNRIAMEVERICRKSDRIQSSGQVRSWQMSLARHRLEKCLTYYHLGSKQGRVELHSSLSAIVYRYIAPMRSQLGFQGRYNLIEDFLQGFYIESLKAFRRESALLENYSPRTQLELAEYMAFTEQYAKRRITLPGHRTQQLIVLRAQGFANRQPPETALDIELAMESPRGEDSEMHSRSAAMQQVREQMVADVSDPTEVVLRDRVVSELMTYLESQGQSDCMDYLTLKLQDLSAPEIDQILGLSARQRDYLQQRFKYHVEKFSRSHQWKLVHQWLGVDLDQNLGLSSQQWEIFKSQLSPEQLQLLQLKRKKANEPEIIQSLKCTPKQAQKRWHQLLDLAWKVRNQANEA